jgi:hypothetical protein
MASVFDCLTAVNTRVCQSLPWLVMPGSETPPPLREIAGKLLQGATVEGQSRCDELIDAMKTVLDSLADVREVFAAGTGLKSVRVNV